MRTRGLALQDIYSIIQGTDIRVLHREFDRLFPKAKRSFDKLTLEQLEQFLFELRQAYLLHDKKQDLALELEKAQPRQRGIFTDPEDAAMGVVAFVDAVVGVAEAISDISSSSDSGGGWDGGGGGFDGGGASGEF